MLYLPKNIATQHYTEYSYMNTTNSLEKHVHIVWTEHLLFLILHIACI